LIFRPLKKIGDDLYMLRRFLRRFGKAARTTPFLIPGQGLRASEGTQEAIQRKPGEFGDAFSSKKIAGLRRPIRMIED
jgi:hypothetical protein